MNMILNRKKFQQDGIFGELCDENHGFLFMTLEHAYVNQDSSYSPKIPQGTYECKRGIHKLHDGVAFTTFEIIGVEGHTGLLFHILNYNSESDGCVGLGMQVGHRQPTGNMLMNSTKAFEAFMKLQDGVDTFLLVVSDSK